MANFGAATVAGFVPRFVATGSTISSSDTGGSSNARSTPLMPPSAFNVSMYCGPKMYGADSNRSRTGGMSAVDGASGSGVSSEKDASYAKPCSTRISTVFTLTSTPGAR